MEPIISPWFIYFIGMADSLSGLFVAVAILSGIGLFLTVVGYLVVTFSDDWEDEDEEKWLKIWGKFRKIAMSILIPFLLLSLLMPTKNTIIGMVVTKQITKENISALVDAGKDVKDEFKADIMELIDSITRKEDR